MEAKQLRIGNWVYSQEIGENVQISSINDEYVTFKDYVTWDYPNYDEINPIPLTEEILLKCGFVLFDKNYDSQDFNVYKLGDFTYNTSHNVFWLHNNYSFTQPKHLHQLQNLYYSLTGEELKIEL